MEPTGDTLEDLKRQIRYDQTRAGESTVIENLKKKGLFDQQAEKDQKNQDLRGAISDLAKNVPETSYIKKVAEKPKTGLRYNEGKLKWHLVDFQSLEPMVKVLMYGADKYTVMGPNGEKISGEDNWKKGLSKKEILDSMLRHIYALLRGEENDQESGLPHIGHIGCNFLFYSYFTTVNGSNARD